MEEEKERRKRRRKELHTLFTSHDIYVGLENSLKG